MRPVQRLAATVLAATLGAGAAAVVGDDVGGVPPLSGTARVSAAARPGPLDFRLASVNVLGSNHTDPRRDADEFAPARVRMEWTMDWLRDSHASIVGFQEIQPDQLAWFRRGFGDKFDVYPGASLGYQGVPTTIAWRTAAWKLVKSRTVTIPFMGQRRIMPLVRLKSRKTGHKVWVMNVHNAPGGLQKQRNRAVRRERSALAPLVERKAPVLVMGDMNERRTAFCKFTGKLDLVAPRGGSHGKACKPPRGLLRVDWIFGSKHAAYGRYAEDRSAVVQRITDHALLSVHVRVP